MAETRVSLDDEHFIAVGPLKEFAASDSSNRRRADYTTFQVTILTQGERTANGSFNSRVLIPHCSRRWQ